MAPSFSAFLMAFVMVAADSAGMALLPKIFVRYVLEADLVHLLRDALDHGVDGGADVADVGELLVAGQRLDELLALLIGRDTDNLRCRGLKVLHQRVHILHLMRQERKRDVLEVEMHRRGKQLIVLLQRLLHDVLADEALQHIIHVVEHLADLAQDGRVIETADGVVGQLLRCDLGAGQAAHVDDGDNLLHAGGAGALDAR
mgnify:CR=1 FL=1